MAKSRIKGFTRNLTLRILDNDGNEVHRLEGEVDLNNINTQIVKIHGQLDTELKIEYCDTIYSLIYKRLVDKAEESERLQGSYSIVMEVIQRFV